MMQQAVLPDILRPGLTIVFCGTAPGTISAARGEYYAHPQNRFWRTLHEVGLTPAQLAPAQFRELPDHGIGLTDIAKHTSGMDSQLPAGSLGEEAIKRLRECILHCKPKVLAFTSLTGGRKFVGPRAVVGPQTEMLGTTRVWILPSPSPAARGSWNIEPWRSLAAAVKSS